jgi:chemotaxis protein CheX
MDPRYISPFITSVKNVFSTMLQLDLHIGDPTIKSSRGTEHDVSGVIEIAGPVTGVVVLSFPTDTAQRVVALLTGEELPSDADGFGDAIGELASMVSGGAKSHFPDADVTLSTPSVVSGKGQDLPTPQDAPCVVIPCSSECGDLAIEVALQTPSAAPAKA